MVKTREKKSLFPTVTKKASSAERDFHRKLNKKFYADFGPIYLHIKENKITIQCLCASLDVVDTLKQNFFAIYPEIKFLMFNIPARGHLLTMRTDGQDLALLSMALDSIPDKGNKVFDDTFLDNVVEFRTNPPVKKNLNLKRPF